MKTNDIIRKLLKRSHMSMSELAKQCGTSQPTVSRWCSGKSEPTVTYIVKLAEIFDVSPITILGIETQTTKRKHYFSRKEEFMKNANAEIKAEMKERGLTFWMLADILEVSESTVYRWFRHELPEDKKRAILDKIKAAQV